MTIMLRLFVFLIYLSLLYELVWIPVPSVASTYQLLFTPPADPRADGILTRVKGWPLGIKLLFLVVPTGIAVCVYIVPLLFAIWPPLFAYFQPVWPLPNLWLALLGGGLAIIGRVIGLGAAYEMHRQPEDSPDFELRTRRFFALTRNPIVVGMYLTFAGLWCLYPTLPLLIGFLFFMGNMHFRVLLEEDFLGQRYGEAYLDFMAKTHRYF